GVAKVMSKMGISTIQSYRGARIFEAIGLSETLVDRYFTKTTSRIGGVGIDEIAQEALAHHARAFPFRAGGTEELLWGGPYQWRRAGQSRLSTPDTAFKPQHATRPGKEKISREYTNLGDDQSEPRAPLRGLFELKSPLPPVPIDEVEPVESLFKRFATG